MCWTRYYQGDHRCIGKLPNAEVKQAAIKLYNLIEYHMDPSLDMDMFELPDLPYCTGRDVKHTWVDDGIYSYDKHVQGLRRYISAYCEECGAKWVESPANAEWLISMYGPNVDWRFTGNVEDNHEY
jgi:hypothetical protein